MDISDAKIQLKKLQSTLSAYNHALELIAYDQETCAPGGVAENTAHALSVLYEEEYKLSTGEQTLSLLDFIDENREMLTKEEQRMVFLLLKDIRQMQKIPMDEYTQYQSLLSAAYPTWVEAKQSSNFEMFRPTLEKIFETNIRFASYCAPDMDPYDYWLDQYEDGLSKEKCDVFFETLKERIVPLVEKIKASEQIDDSCLHGYFPREKQEQLSVYLMDTLGLDRNHCTLGTTEHPFTISIGSHFDERITTNYKTDDFSSSMFSVIHESGHALYDTGSDNDFAYTVLDGGVSMGIHESQSRFYENILCRSRSFTSFLLPKLKELFGDENPALRDVSPDDFYKAVNRVEPSLIRTEADEVTYCLHVMIRYEIEKKAMFGQLEVKDFPSEWNRLYEQYLGVCVPDDKHGVLQDSHWSGGSIGYFPSYALGSAYGAQFLRTMSHDVDINGCLIKGSFSEINAWNREKIWKHGRLFRSDALLTNILGEDFDANVYADYLEKKYSEIYGF